MRILIWSIACLAAVFAAGAVSAAPMTFKLASNGGVCPDCRWIAAEGEIVEASPSRLAKFLKANPRAEGLVVRINSDGGDLAASMDLGRLIRERGLKTAVSRTVFEPKAPKDRLSARWTKGACASACTYAFLGGVERSVDENSRLGVHQFYSDAPRGRGAGRGSFAVAQTAINDLGVYMADMGVGGSLILAAAATSPVNMHWLTREELESYHAVTDVRSPEEANWSFAQTERGLYLVSRQVQKNGTVTEYRMTCSSTKPRSIHLLATRSLKAAPSERYGDIRKSLHGAKLHPSAKDARDLSLGDVQINQDTLQINGDMDRATFQRMIGEKAGELYVNLDVAADYAGYVGGASHRFPVKNLGEAMPVLFRNCA
jgi:hypothetical protein